MNAVAVVVRPLSNAIRKSYADGADLLRTAGWSCGLAWSTGRLFFAARLILAVTVGLVPAAFAVVIRGLVNAVVVASQQPEPALSTVLPWLLAGLGVTLFEVVSRMFDRYAAGRFHDNGPKVAKFLVGQVPTCTNLVTIERLSRREARRNCSCGEDAAYPQ